MPLLLPLTFADLQPGRVDRLLEKEEIIILFALGATIRFLMTALI